MKCFFFVFLKWRNYLWRAPRYTNYFHCHKFCAVTLRHKSQHLRLILRHPSCELLLIQIKFKKKINRNMYQTRQSGDRSVCLVVLCWLKFVFKNEARKKNPKWKKSKSTTAKMLIVLRIRSFWKVKLVSFTWFSAQAVVLCYALFALPTILSLHSYLSLSISFILWTCEFRNNLFHFGRGILHFLEIKRSTTNFSNANSKRIPSQD